MKIVFLDIDGVLQPAWSRKRFEHINEIEEVASRLEARNPDYEYRAYVTAEQGPHGTPYSRNIRRYNLAAVYFDWSKSAVAYFTDILQKSDAKIVISSDWRDEGEYAIKLFLSVYGLDKYYYGLVDASYYVSVGDRYIKRDFPRQKQAWNSSLAGKTPFPAWKRGRSVSLVPFRHPGAPEFRHMVDPVLKDLFAGPAQQRIAVGGARGGAGGAHPGGEPGSAGSGPL